MDLSIVIVNYNVKYFIEQSIQSIFRSKTNYSFEVIVVDNNSTDGSVELIKKKFPQITLIENKSNLGFSKANNQGFKHCNGRYTLILNPDTLLEESSIEKCIQFMDGNPKAGALGVRMIDGTGNFLMESKRGFPHPSVSFFKFSGLYRLFPRSKKINAYYQGHIDEDQTAEVDVLSGAFTLARTDLLLSVGGFDEDYFMYGEDIDLSYQFQKAGFKNYYLPETTIVHYKGESTKKGSLNYVKVFYQAMIIFAQKHLRKQYSFLFILALRLAIYTRGALTVLRNIFRKISLPVIEIGLSLLLILFFQQLWAIYYHNDPEYFSQAPTTLNLLIYSGIFFISMFLQGAYDHPFDQVKIRKGITTAAILFSIWYALANEEWRTSRMILIMTIVIASAVSILVRSILKGIKTGNYIPFSSPVKRIAIVALREEFDRASSIFNSLNVKAKIIGRITPNADDEGEQLGIIDDLPSIIRAKNLNSLIFCSKDISSEKIMSWMTKLNKQQLEFKLMPQESDSIIGSSSSNLPGELYTVDMQYAIRAIENKRAKRILDIVVSVLIIVLTFLFSWIKSIRTLHINAWKVLLGKKTWVGYIAALDEDLPMIKEAIWSIGQKDDQLESKKMKNFLYARDYNWRKDLKIIISNIFVSNG